MSNQNTEKSNNNPQISSQAEPKEGVTRIANSSACHNLEVGKQGEDLAALMLSEHGWKIIDRNWRCREGEIDIIATKGNHLAFVEVKTRTSEAFGRGAEAVSSEKIRHIRHAGSRWLQQSQRYCSLISIDVVEVSLRPNLPALIRFIRSVG